ncbi:LTA synthase family protein [bacterium]|nr:LTA synthase family protein [bacterium]
MIKLFKTPKNIELNEYIVLLYRIGLMMLLFSLQRLVFYFFNTDLFANVSSSGFGLIMLGGLKFDISALLYVNSLYIIFFLIPLPFKYSNGYRKGLKWLFVLTNGLGMAANAIDVIYYQFILKRTTASVFSILKNEENMGRLSAQFIIDYWYVAVIFVVFIYGVIRLYSIFSQVPIKFAKKWQFYPVSVLFLLLSLVLSVVGIRGGYKHSTRPITMSNAGRFVESPEEMAIVLNTPFCIIRTIGKKPFKEYRYFTNEGELEQVYSPLRKGSNSSEMRKDNVVIIILESFSREHSGFLNPMLDGKPYKGYTPFFDSIMANSFVFPNAYANGRKSIDALPSVTASIPSLGMPYVISEYSSNKINSLASTLKPKGYSSSFFHGAPNGSMGFLSFTKIAEFDKYYGATEYGNNDDFDGMWGIWDEEFFQFYAQELNETPTPFISAIFSVSSHHPFKVPERYEGVFPQGPLRVHQCVGYTDMALRKFFESAKKMPWYDNTLFVITADHSTKAFSETYQSNINKFAIPLMFYKPDNSLQGISNKLAMQIDIMPTVLSYLNYPEDYIAYGHDLFNEDKEGFAINFFSGNYQFMKDSLVYYFDGKKLNGIYNFNSDLALENDLSSQVHSRYNSLQFLKAVIQQYNNRMIEDRLCL